MVITPALDAAHGSQRAGVVLARGNCSHATGQAIHVHRRWIGAATPGGGAVAEFAIIVVTPAFDAAGYSKRASVLAIRCRRNCDNAAGEAANIHRRRVRVESPAVVGDTKFAVLVDAPAFDTAGRGQRASVAVARGNGNEPAGKAADVNRIRVRVVTSAGGGDAELAETVVAPAFGAPGQGQRAGVKAACGDGDDAAAKPADAGWQIRSLVPGLGGDAELAIIVYTPAFDAAGRGQCAGMILARGKRMTDAQRVDGNGAAKRARAIHELHRAGGCAVAVARDRRGESNRLTVLAWIERGGRCRRRCRLRVRLPAEDCRAKNKNRGQHKLRRARLIVPQKVSPVTR